MGGFCPRGVGWGVVRGMFRDRARDAMLSFMDLLWAMTFWVMSAATDPAGRVTIGGLIPRP